MQKQVKITIRLSRKSDLRAYTDLLQRTFQRTYASEKLGLKRAYFSRRVFNTESTQDYLKESLRQGSNQRAWLAFYGSRLVGSVTMTRKGKDCELRGFYVDSRVQGKGIGKALYNLGMKFAGSRDIVLDLYAHSTKTLGMYKRWGYRIDRTRGRNGVFYRHWPEWPEGIRAKCYYMRLSTTPSARTRP